MPEARARLAALLACLLSLAYLPASWQALLEYRREAILGGEVWRLWSGHVVHFGLAHALVDVAALGMLFVLARRFGVAMRALPWLFLIVPGVSLGLLVVEPGLGVYRGLSALDMALFVVVLHAAWRQRPTMRLVLALIAVLALAKSLADFWGLAPTLLTDGVRVAASAHLLGLAAGTLLALRTRSADTDTRPGFV